MNANTQKLAQLELEYTMLREENVSLASARRIITDTDTRFQTPINQMQPLDFTPTSRDIHPEIHQTPATVVDPLSTLCLRYDTNNATTRQNVTLPREGDTARLMGPEQEITKSAEAEYLEAIFSKRLDQVQAMIERLLGVLCTLHSYDDTPFSDEIALTEMPRKFMFPAMKMYDGTTDPDNHVAQY